MGIPSFLTTLAMMGFAKGVAVWISATAAVPILSPGYSWAGGGVSIGPIPVLLFWKLVIGTIGHFVLRRTGFGRRVLATGGGETAARYSGIDTAGIKFKVLVLSSTAAAIAGMLYAGRLQSGTCNWAAFNWAAFNGVRGMSCPSSPQPSLAAPACLAASAPSLAPSSAR